MIIKTRLIISTTVLKITFENLPIIKIVEKKSPTMVGRQENFFEAKILSLSGLFF